MLECSICLKELGENIPDRNGELLCEECYVVHREVLKGDETNE